MLDLCTSLHVITRISSIAIAALARSFIPLHSWSFFSRSFLLSNNFRTS